MTPTTNISPYLNRQLANWAPQDAEKKEHDKLIDLCQAFDTIKTKIQFDTLIKYKQLQLIKFQNLCELDFPPETLALSIWFGRERYISYCSSLNNRPKQKKLR